MAGYPIPDGGVWNGDTGREWEATGSDLERFEFAAYGGLSWKVQVAQPTAAYGVWGSWVVVTGRVQDLQTQRQVTDWHLGPRSARGSVTLENVDEGASVYQVGSRIRLSVNIPSGNTNVFTGMVTDIVSNLDGQKYPTLTFVFTDDLGFYSQDAATELSTATSTTDVILWNLINQSTRANVSKAVGMWDAAGVTQQQTIGTYALSTRLSQYVRGELGLLWLTRTGDWAYKASNWWSSNRATAVAAIGSDVGTPPDPYIYRFPLARVSPRRSLRESATYVIWNSLASGSPHLHLNLTQNQRYGTRTLQVSTLLTLNADATRQATLLADHLSDPDDYPGPYDLTFPADLSVDAMEYGAVAEIADYINWAEESLEGYWQNWVEGHVLGVAHRWNPGQGWWVTLTVTQRLWENNEE